MKAIRDASPQAGHVEMNTFIRSGDRSTRCLDLYLCIDGRRYFHDEGRGGKSIDYPQDTDVTFKKAQRVRPNPSEKQKNLPMPDEPPEK